jgi:hypothetical protein
MNTSGESACKKAPVPRLLTTVSTERRRGLFNLFGFFASLADDFVSGVIQVLARQPVFPARQPAP